MTRHVRVSLANDRGVTVEVDVTTPDGMQVPEESLLDVAHGTAREALLSVSAREEIPF